MTILSNFLQDKNKYINICEIRPIFYTFLFMPDVVQTWIDFCDFTS